MKDGLFLVVIVVQIVTMICLLRLNKLLLILVQLLKVSDLSKEDAAVKRATREVKNARKRIPTPEQ